MPRTVPADYFERAPFSGAAPGQLFHWHTCLQCGHRERTWARFESPPAGLPRRR